MSGDGEQHEKSTTLPKKTATTTKSENKERKPNSGMSNAVKDIVFNNQLYDDLEQNPPTRRLHHKELNPKKIEKLKGFLKPYYKKKIVTKEQWKAVMKDAVRDMCRKPTKFTNDEEIKLFVQQNVAAYVKR